MKQVLFWLLLLLFVFDERCYCCFVVQSIVIRMQNELSKQYLKVENQNKKVMNNETRQHNRKMRPNKNNANNKDAQIEKQS